MRDRNYRCILIADDDSEDCMLLKEAFGESGLDTVFHCVSDGFALMDYLDERLRTEGPEGLPGLILLDLNMPKKDGRTVLVEIKSDPALKDIPIVILSTSGEQKDIDCTMKAGAESFITKPASFDEWIEIASSLAKDWLGGCQEDS